MYKNINKKIVVTIEARMTSTRLPGKVLMPLAGKPALERLIERIKTSKYVDETVLATTTNATDKPLVELAKRLGIKYFCGSEDDVLSRVLGAAQSVNGDIIVEITGDCPLIYGDFIDRGIKEFFTQDVDYAANIIKRSYPDGFDIQVFPVAVLAVVDKLTNDPIDRVHVSHYIYRHPERFKLYNWEARKNRFWPDLRVTLDEKNDYELLNEIFVKLITEKKYFTIDDVIIFLKKHKDLLFINKNVRTKDVQEG